MYARSNHVVSFFLGIVMTISGTPTRVWSQAETPGSNRVVVFSPFGNLKDASGEALIVSALTYVMSLLEEQNYSIEPFMDITGCTDDDPTLATVPFFFESSKAGILVYVGHGNSTDLMVEVYKTETALDAAYDKYIKGNAYTDKEIVKGEYDFGNEHCYGISVTAEAIKNKWKDNNTIVYLASCCSSGLAASFGAREFFGYSDKVPFADILPDMQLLWARMHGHRDNGAKRPAALAFSAGGYSPFFMHKQREKADTVLSPSVVRHLPADDSSYAVPTTVDGAVVFETRMDRTVDPATVVTVSGCDGESLNPAWGSVNTFDFALRLKSPGTATITIHHDKARAERDFKNDLDGNTESRPPLRDRVGKNRDDFVWHVKCVEQREKEKKGD